MSRMKAIFTCGGEGEAPGLEGIDGGSKDGVVVRGGVVVRDGVVAIGGGRRDGVCVGGCGSRGGHSREGAAAAAGESAGESGCRGVVGRDNEPDADDLSTGMLEDRPFLTGTAVLRSSTRGLIVL